VIPDGDQELVPGGKVSIEAALGGSRLRRDVLHPTLGGSTLSENAQSGVEKLPAPLVGMQATAGPDQVRSGRRTRRTSSRPLLNEYESTIRVDDYQSLR
jgi:hypothetical protein